MSSVRESVQPKHARAWLLFGFPSVRKVEDVCEDAVATPSAVTCSWRRICKRLTSSLL